MKDIVITKNIQFLDRKENEPIKLGERLKLRVSNNPVVRIKGDTAEVNPKPNEI